ncbi:ATP-dependent DNA helicase PIF1-like protein, partial [Tanacetum coccineum]
MSILEMRKLILENKISINGFWLLVTENCQPKKEAEDEPTWIQILEEFLIQSWNSPIEKIVSKTYPKFTKRQTDDQYLKERGILTPRNDDADAINEYMFKKLGGVAVTYNSIHGQLYVALSRVTTPDGLKILMIEDEDKEL